VPVPEPAEFGFEILFLPKLLDDPAETLGVDSHGVPSMPLPHLAVLI
jgi:hypothetical protein